MVNNNLKSFTYGGYKFVPCGQFTDYGFKKDATMFEIVRCLFSINRGCVADGHEKYDYKEFYKASGDCVADVFFCPQTQERYVPCGEYLAILDKSATSDEVKRRFERRRVRACINEGADLHSDALFDDLFDDGEYIDNERRYSGVDMVLVLGFIHREPVMVIWWLGLNKLNVTYLPRYCGSLEMRDRIQILKDALTGEEVEPEIKQSESDTLNVSLYYTPAYVAKNMAPQE